MVKALIIMFPMSASRTEVLSTQDGTVLYCFYFIPGNSSDAFLVLRWQKPSFCQRPRQPDRSGRCM